MVRTVTRNAHQSPIGIPSRAGAFGELLQLCTGVSIDEAVAAAQRLWPGDADWWWIFDKVELADSGRPTLNNRKLSN